jgi:hypothetical protein
MEYLEKRKGAFRMRKLGIALTTALLLASTSAMAATITFTAQEDGGATTTVPTPTATSSIGPVAFGDFTILATGSTNGPGGVPPPFLLQGNTISVQQTVAGSHTLDLNVLGVGLTSPTGLTALLSGFDATGLSTGWVATISTDINGTIIDSSTFTGPISGGHDAAFAAFNLPATFNASVDFHIVTNGGGAANLGGALSAAAVPGPIVGAGLPGLLGMLGFGGWQWTRRKKKLAIA